MRHTTLNGTSTTAQLFEFRNVYSVLYPKVSTRVEEGVFTVVTKRLATKLNESTSVNTALAWPRKECVHMC